ncbi:MAG: hypothetical protein NT105_00285 [Verrucomicrobia bacterium]|nr:hypothetical protein [Verrucomicrobiota bacterium]
MNIITDVDSVRLDQAGLAWFNSLKNKCLAILPLLTSLSASQAVAKTEVEKLLAVDPNALLQQHLADLEDWLIVLLSGPDLKQWVNSLRDDYREIFGTEAFQRMLPTLVSQVSAATDVELLAEARRLQAELHWHYSLQPWAMQKRQEMMAGILGILILAIFGFGCIWVLSKVCALGGKVLFAGLLALLGTFGGSFSSIQRVQSADLTNSRAVSMARQERFALGVILSPLQGGFFALLFTLALLAGVATPGFVVPNVSLESSDSACSSTAVAPLTNPVPSPKAKTTQLRIVDSHGALRVGTNSTNVGNATVSPTKALKPVETKKESTSTGTGVTSEAKPDSTPPADKKDEAKKSKSNPKENKQSVPFFNMMLCFDSGKDIALLIIWAVIAGLSERLVPDLLSRIAQKGKA